MAILLVLIWHFVGCAVRPGSLIWKLTSISWCGVDLFFVLSGFLIGGILMDNSDSPKLLRTFYLRRMARIFPVYYAVAFLAFLAFYLRSVNTESLHESISMGVPWWSYFLHLQNIFMAKSGLWGFHPLQVTWSLAVEEQFYLIFPSLIIFANPRWWPQILITGIASGWLLRVLFFYFHPHPAMATYVLLPCRWDALFSGALLAWVVRFKPSLLDWLLIPAVNKILMILLGAGYITLILIGSGIGSLNAVFFGHSFFAFAGVVLIAICVVAPSSLLAALFRQKWLCFLGMISYSLYLTHMFAQRAMYWLCSGSTRPLVDGFAGVITAALGLLLAISVATASWHFFEKPIVQKMRRRTSY